MCATILAPLINEVESSAVLPIAAQLPVHLTRFIGRTSELEEISRMLKRTRLLTLTGAGGSGKTRLAREAAAGAASDFANIGWADLAPLTDSTLVPQVVANSLRLPDRAFSSAIDSLGAAIGGDPTLLVLDNCEHLIDACASVVERLLRECPRLRVVATSREALGIPSETAWLVPPLLDNEAIQLFIERAKAALPSFSANATTVATLGDICTRLDGIPLAIELAAARIRVLSPDQIAGRLDDAFRLLTSGSRTAIPRHRTLRGTMDWSYGLLDDREQRLLRRLSVFAGSFTLEAAEAVCAGVPLEVEDILDGVAALVDKSLVVMEAGDGIARYHLLETVKQYGIELLVQASELEHFQSRHCEYFLEFAEEIEPLVIGGEHEPGTLARVGPDHSNLRAAATWALNHPARVNESLRFADSLFWFWYSMTYWLQAGQFREARKYVDAALARSKDAEPLLRAKALLSSGLIALAQSDNERALEGLTDSYEIVKAHGDVRLRTYVLAKLSAARLMVGDVDQATEAADHAYELSKTLAPDMIHAFVYYWRGTILMSRGDTAGAKETLEMALDLANILQHRTIRAHACSQYGRLFLIEDNTKDAFIYLSEAMRTHVEICDAWGLAMDLEAIATLIMKRGRVVDGVRLFGATDALRERMAIGMPAVEKPERDRLVAIAKQTLGDRFKCIYEEGASLSMDQVVHLATDAGGTQTAEYQVQSTYSALVTGVHAASKASPQPKLRVLGLGSLQVFINDEPIDSAAWGSARPRELLVYLLMHPEGRTKEQVGLIFWPEASSAQLRNSFHVTLHRLRKALRNPNWITAINDRYRVDPAVIDDFDVATFEREVTMARRALKRKEDGAAAALERALGLYRGDFLDGEPAGDWHIEHRDRFQRLFADGLMELGVQFVADGRYPKAADAFRRVLARDELHEDAALALMQTHAQLGERAQAIRFYQRFAERLRRELNAEPGNELVELYEELKEGPSSL